MTRFSLHFLTGLVAALACAGLRTSGQIELDAAQSGANSDLLTLASHAAGVDAIWISHATAFALGFAASMALPLGGEPVRRVALRVLAVFNPALLAASVAHPSAALAAVASLALWGAVFRLSTDPGERTTIALAAALVAAPLISFSALVFYPALIVLAPALSPWGMAPRRALGFMTVLFAPFIMLAAGAAYLAWLFAPAAAYGIPIGGAGMPDLASIAALGAAPCVLLAAAAGRRAGLVFVAAGAAAIVLAPIAALGPLALASVLAAAHVGWAGAYPRRAGAILLAGCLAGALLALLSGSLDVGSIAAAVAPASASP